jgi:transcriptional regulator with XRE-family HTH domain
MSYSLQAIRIRGIVQLTMAPQKESEILIAELKAWCEEQYGRRAEVAERIGVSRQVVTDWLHGRAVPSLDNGLKLQAFLKKVRRTKARARAL